MSMWKFANAWDYHEQGAFVTVAETADEAAAQVNAFIAARPPPPETGYFPGFYDKEPEPGTYTADDAILIGPVFVAEGYDD